MTKPRSEGEQAFTKEELTRGHWVKIGQHGVSRVVQFSPDGTLSEQDLFSPLPFRMPRAINHEFEIPQSAKSWLIGESLRLSSASAFDSEHEYSWLGKWQLERGGQELIITVGPWQLHVEPERRFNIHAGYERNTKDPNYHGNFQLIHVG